MPAHTLSNRPYEILLAVDLTNSGVFVRTYYLGTPTWIVLSHVVISAVLLAAWIRIGVEAEVGTAEWLTSAGWSVLLYLFLVPLHELLHGAVHWMLGATDIRFTASLTRMDVSVMAHRHVVSAREFIWVTVAPFLCITTLVALLISLLSDQSLLMLGVLTAHTVGCAGDWAMMNFVWSQRHIELYTFDDADERMTYFVTSDPGER